MEKIIDVVLSVNGKEEIIQVIEISSKKGLFHAFKFGGNENMIHAFTTDKKEGMIHAIKFEDLGDLASLKIGLVTDWFQTFADVFLA